jgi:predicted RNA-binding Zn-ribbon protein involved in translation (DUF1610 family)
MYEDEECWPPCCGGAGCPSCGDGSEYEERSGDAFRDPGGRSALRAGIRIHPCPSCGELEALTAADVRLGYQCDACADRAEGYGS